MPLNAENCMQNMKKKSNFNLVFFFHFDGKKCLHILVYVSVKSLFLAHLYESTESYCYHFGLGIGVTLYSFMSKLLNNHWPKTFYIRNTGQKHMISEI